MRRAARHEIGTRHLRAREIESDIPVRQRCGQIISHHDAEPARARQLASVPTQRGADRRCDGARNAQLRKLARNAHQRLTHAPGYADDDRANQTSHSRVSARQVRLAAAVAWARG